jgi:hypothetical protein
VQIIEADSSEIDRKEDEVLSRVACAPHYIVVVQVYERIVGIRKSFAYHALHEGAVLQKWFDCWCPACMAADAPGDRADGAEMNSNYQVPNCECTERWYFHSVRLLGNRGIGAAKRAAQKYGRDNAPLLKPGTFIAVQDREAAEAHESPFLIGITIDAGNGSCIVKEAKGREMYRGTRFDQGDFAIAVKWLSRLDEDPEFRTFELSNDPSEEDFVVNSTELRLASVELELVSPIGEVVRRSSRSSTYASSRAQISNNQYLNRKYTLSTQQEQTILKICC